MRRSGHLTATRESLRQRHGERNTEMETPPLFVEDQELAERFRLELRYFARQQRGMDAAEAERAIEQTTEDLVRIAREYALQLVQSVQNEG